MRAPLLVATGSSQPDDAIPLAFVGGFVASSNGGAVHQNGALSEEKATLSRGALAGRFLVWLASGACEVASSRRA